VAGGGGGSTNSAEDRGHREGGYGGSSPLVRGFTQFVIEQNPVLIRLLQIIFHGTENLARLLQNFGISGGGFEPPPPWVRQWFRLSRRQLKMVVATLTRHAPVRKHLHTIGLFEGDPTCRLCRKETETAQHIIWCCEALAVSAIICLGVWRSNRQTYVTVNVCDYECM
jgi:hypothetical protein